MTHPDYAAYTATDLLRDYSAARRQVAASKADMRDAKRVMAEREAFYQAGTPGKNAEERKANLAITLSQDADYTTAARMFAAAQDVLEAAEEESDILSKYLAAKQADERTALRESLDRIGAPSDGSQREAAIEALIERKVMELLEVHLSRNGEFIPF